MLICTGLAHMIGYYLQNTSSSRPFHAQPGGQRYESMKRFRNNAATTILLGLAGFSFTSSLSAETPIWPYIEAPVPIDPISLSPGEEITLKLGASTSPHLVNLNKATIPGGLPVEYDIIDNTTLKLKAKDVESRRGLVTVTGVDGTGKTHQVDIPVSVQSLPEVTFTYDPGKNSPADRVFAAGSFNGWNPGSHPLKEQPDGTFELTVEVSPGPLTYKLVVDGEWMADPSNPEKDTSGYGNSLIDVPGSVREKFSMLYLPKVSDGNKAHFTAILNNEEELLKDTVTIVYNNKKVADSMWSLDGRSSTINLDLTDVDTFDEDWIYIYAETNQDRFTESSFMLTSETPTRSPRDEVMYFTMTDRFHNGDTSNDWKLEDDRPKELAKYQGGDFAGIEAKIEEGYFKNLGVTTLWISPPNENTPKVEKETVDPGDFYTSYHGYWPISSTETNPHFGSMEDLKSLVETAHENGIAILIDFVANHVHEDHPLIQENPTWSTSYELEDGRDNLRLFDEYPFTTWFDSFLPSFDYSGNNELIDFQIDSAIYWLEETGADGFRHDAVKHIPKEFWSGLTEKLHDKFSEGERKSFVYQVGETISGYGTVAEFVGQEMLTGQFDFPGYFVLKDVVGLGQGGMDDLAKTIEDAKAYYPMMSIMSPLAGNHDVSRFLAYADGDLPSGEDEKVIGRDNPPEVDNSESYEKLIVAYAWLMSIPGMPMIYYGDEIGITGAGDPDNRRPMIWDESNVPEEALAIRDHLAKLGQARQSSLALRRGNSHVLFSDDEFLLLLRTAKGEATLTMLARNPESSKLIFALPDYLSEVKGLSPLATKDTSVEIVENAIRFDLNPYSYGVWEIEFE